LLKGLITSIYIIVECNLRPKMLARVGTKVAILTTPQLTPQLTPQPTTTPKSPILQPFIPTPALAILEVAPTSIALVILVASIAFIPPATTTYTSLSLLQPTTTNFVLTNATNPIPQY
jgi:hypothetical protein